MTTVASHVLGLQVAAVRVPFKQLDVPDDLKPLLHAWTQVDPDASVELQFPLVPFVGPVLASHGLGLHLAAVRVPFKQVDLPETL